MLRRPPRSTRTDTLFPYTTLFRSLIAKPFFIPSGSMLPSLWIGARLIVSKWPYGWSYVSPSFHVLPLLPGRVLGRLPERGDIVIVHPPGSNSDFLQRVSGLPGATRAGEDGREVQNEIGREEWWERVVNCG